MSNENFSNETDLAQVIEIRNNLIRMKNQLVLDRISICHNKGSLFNHLIASETNNKKIIDVISRNMAKK